MIELYIDNNLTCRADESTVWHLIIDLQLQIIKTSMLGDMVRVFTTQPGVL
jgi:hypothetical protein